MLMMPQRSAAILSLNVDQGHDKLDCDHDRSINQSHEDQLSLAPK